jgi:hypothetical protein
MKVRTPDGVTHDLPPADATRLIHTAGAAPVAETPVERAEKRPADEKRAEKRAGKRKA